MPGRVNLNTQQFRKRLCICIVVAMLAIVALAIFLLFPVLIPPSSNDSNSIDVVAKRLESNAATTKESKAMSQPVESLATERVTGEPHEFEGALDETANLDPWKERIWKAYPELSEVLNLSPTRSEELTNILAMQLLDAHENHPLVGPGELEWDEYNKPEWVLEMEAKQARWDKEIAAYLGDEKYIEWQQYRRTTNARHLIRLLQTRLEGTPDSLEADQVEPLVAALTEREQSIAYDSRSFATRNPVNGWAAQNERLKEGAMGYLSSRQMIEFSRMLDEQIARSRARQPDR